MTKEKRNVIIVTKTNGVETNRATRFTTVYTRNDGTSFIHFAFSDRDVKLNKHGSYEFAREIKGVQLTPSRTVRLAK
jgi:hypothetical protein